MKRKDVTIIDYGSGNLLSLKRAFEFCGANVIITSNYKIISNASRIVLPGVGAFGNAMKKINILNLKEEIVSTAEKGIPFLGVCLGMQLLMSESEEFGSHKGLNLLQGKVKSIKDIIKNKKDLKIPLIGWKTIHETDLKNINDPSFLKKIKKSDFFYFLHSFVSLPNNVHERKYDVIYEGVKLPAIIGKKNIFGFQFHPEKSGRTGLKLLEEFLKV